MSASQSLLSLDTTIASSADRVAVVVEASGVEVEALALLVLEERGVSEKALVLETPTPVGRKRRNLG